jgi:transposase
MARPRKAPLRCITEEERSVLEQVSRSRSEPAERVARARILLSLAEGTSFVRAAQVAGRRSRVSASMLAARFNQEGLAALEPRHGGGPAKKYGPGEQERILQEFNREPDLEKDGTKTWSLSTLQRALQRAEDGLPGVSTWTIFQVLHRAGLSFQQSRTWCHTGEVLRKRKEGVVSVKDPRVTEKRGI